MCSEIWKMYTFFSQKFHTLDQVGEDITQYKSANSLDASVYKHFSFVFKKYI